MKRLISTCTVALLAISVLVLTNSCGGGEEVTETIIPNPNPAPTQEVWVRLVPGTNLELTTIWPDGKKSVGNAVTESAPIKVRDGAELNVSAQVRGRFEYSLDSGGSWASWSHDEWTTVQGVGGMNIADFIFKLGNVPIEPQLANGAVTATVTDQLFGESLETLTGTMSVAIGESALEAYFASQFPDERDGNGTVILRRVIRHRGIDPTAYTSRTFVRERGSGPVPEPVSGLAGTVVDVEIVSGPDPVYPGDSVLLRVFVEGWRIGTGATQPPTPDLYVSCGTLSGWQWKGGGIWLVTWTAPGTPGTCYIGPEPRLTIIVIARPVEPALTTVTVSPPTATVEVGATKTFQAAGKDQSGDTLMPSWAWSTSGGGTISGAGDTIVFTATTVGTFTVTATGTYNGKSVSGTATVIVEDGGGQTGQTLQILDAPINLELGEAHQVRVALKENGTWVRELGSSEFTCTIAGLPEEDSWVQTILSNEAVIRTWQDSGAPDYTVTGYMTPGTYTLTVTFGSLTEETPVEVTFIST